MPWFNSNKESGGALRRLVMLIHDAVVDRTVALTQQPHWNMGDSFEFRFDVIVFLMSSVLHRLHGMKQPHTHHALTQCAQQLWDVMFESLEESLRDRGVTDIRMAARMRRLLQHAMGRRRAYLEAWQQKAPQAAIQHAVARNIFNGAPHTDPRIERFLAASHGVPESVLPGDLTKFLQDHTIP